jgi:hypothetical protein
VVSEPPRRIQCGRDGLACGQVERTLQVGAALTART